MPKGISVHIGLNAVDPACYEGWDGSLAGCENDAHSMEQVAVSLKYKTQLLLTNAATSSAVIDAIKSAARQLNKDDIFFLTYSGHGGQVDDLNGDEKDGKDETWVLFDRELVDDELHQLYCAFKAGVRIIVLSDSCHSGTVTRALYERTAPLESEVGLRSHPLFRSKRIPREIESAVQAKNAAVYKDIQAATREIVKKSPAATIILVSGCQDNQLSSDGDVNGLFTEKLLKVWNHGNFKQDYRQFQKAIKKLMPPSQQPNYFVIGRPNKVFEHQRPFVIATAAAAAHP